MREVFGQGAYRVRFDWGPAGAERIADGAACVVVVDVLSFTTALTVAAEHGISVLPYRWRDASAVAEAARHRAELAVGRMEARSAETVSLSPPTIARAAAHRRIERLVLPSPNGSAISARMAAIGATVVGVSLRNSAAAAAWVRQRAAGRPIAVVAAGERWPDDSLRPAAEDLWGAGAFLDAFVAHRPEPDDVSFEAGAAIAAYRAVAADLPAALAASVSGRELAARGFEADVATAADAGASTVVPVLGDGWFRPHPAGAAGA
ncbi:2-phosphosulfolactate phosphatase [Actinoplanes lobatus]|uniref:Probable 2-phosphosulfolactate phosphatase n=1 Tax=Actinoplanes lobatus TaxID=113568 RepID=A0A7W7MD83_9ACTN|nr:2-phosphosulfolactate phosphatase [Actinoplanes lobatus]MBB4745966.1 2-phosphosulfolactate phosphatase [Actinoplanes lobatus]